MPFTIVDVLFRFEGRLGRLAYFGYSVFVLLATVALVVGAVNLAQTGTGYGAAMALLILIGTALGSVWTSTALSVKRLHDTNLSGLHMIWIFIVNALANALTQQAPTLSLLFAAITVAVGLWMLFAPGTKGDNQFGPGPFPAPKDFQI